MGCPSSWSRRVLRPLALGHSDKVLQVLHELRLKCCIGWREKQPAEFYWPIYLRLIQNVRLQEADRRVPAPRQPSGWAMSEVRTHWFTRGVPEFSRPSRRRFWFK